MKVQEKGAGTHVRSRCNGCKFKLQLMTQQRQLMTQQPQDKIPTGALLLLGAAAVPLAAVCKRSQVHATLPAERVFATTKRPNDCMAALFGFYIYRMELDEVSRETLSLQARRRACLQHPTRAPNQQTSHRARYRLHSLVWLLKICRFYTHTMNQPDKVYDGPFWSSALTPSMYK